MPGIRSIEVPEIDVNGIYTLKAETETAQESIPYSEPLFLKEQPKLQEEWEILSVIFPQVGLAFEEVVHLEFFHKATEESITKLEVESILKQAWLRPTVEIDVAFYIKKGGQIRGILQNQFPLRYAGIEVTETSLHKWAGSIYYRSMVGMSIDLTNPISVESSERLEMKAAAVVNGSRSWNKEIPNVYKQEKIESPVEYEKVGTEATPRKGLVLFTTIPSSIFPIEEPPQMTIREISTLIEASHETAPPRRVK